MERHHKEDGLQCILSADEIVIFGTGYVAESFWFGLERLDLTAKVSCFAVSDSSEHAEQLHNRPVRPISNVELRPDILVCLAVHSALAEELDRYLSDLIPGQFIWVYPFLYDLIYGKPLIKGVQRQRSELIRKQNSSFNWISVRYMAARDYLCCSVDYELSRETYIKAMSAHCRVATAAERLNNLERLADSMASNGYDDSCPILVDSSLRIIDGLHRIAVASVLKIDSIACDMVMESAAYDVLLGDNNKLPDYMLIKAGLSSMQLRKLAEAKQELIMSIQ